MTTTTNNQPALTFTSNKQIVAEIKRLSPQARGLGKATKILLMDRLAETSLRSSYSALAHKRSGRPSNGHAYNLDALGKGATWAEARIRPGTLALLASHWTALPALKNKFVCFLLDTCEVCDAALASQPRYLAQVALGGAVLDGLTQATYLPPRPAEDCMKLACTGCAEKANQDAMAELDAARAETNETTRRTPRARTTSLSLEAPVEITIKGRAHSKTATLNTDGTVEMEGTTYSSPSKAAGAVYGVSRNGWKTWRLSDGSFIDTLRA